MGDGAFEGGFELGGFVRMASQMTSDELRPGYSGEAVQRIYFFCPPSA